MLNRYDKNTIKDFVTRLGAQKLDWIKYTLQDILGQKF